MEDSCPKLLDVGGSASGQRGGNSSGQQYPDASPLAPRETNDSGLARSHERRLCVDRPGGVGMAAPPGHGPSRVEYHGRADMAIEYIGHKDALLDFIVNEVQASTKGGRRLVADLFCGTAAVSAEFRRRGYRVIANDALQLCATFAAARLLNGPCPTFSGVLGTAGGDPARSPHDRVLAHLDGLRPRSGFVHQHYSPASREFDGVSRMYFTESNAGRIDAVRHQIAEWDDHLAPGERALLLASLVLSANAVSNIAGTYGCFLKRWKTRALDDFRLRPVPLSPGRTDHEIHCADAEWVASRTRPHIVYADPPYTKRQYAAYYHVLETIVRDDRPVLEGSTGLRRWQEQSSDFCYRRKAPDALRRLLERVRCRHFFLSYNEDGQIHHDEILDILGKCGQVDFSEVQIRRYKSSRRPHKGSSVRERLYHLVLG